MTRNTREYNSNSHIQLFDEQKNNYSLFKRVTTKKLYYTYASNDVLEIKTEGTNYLFIIPNKNKDETTIQRQLINYSKIWQWSRIWKQE